MPPLYPERPVYSPWSDIGSALTQGAGIVNDFQQSRNALQALVDKRSEAAMERRRQEREDAMKLQRQESADAMNEIVFSQQQADRTTQIQSADTKESNMNAFKTYVAGTPSRQYMSPGMGPNSESATAPVIPSRGQIQNKGLELGVYGDPGVKAYMDDTKPPGLSPFIKPQFQQGKDGFLYQWNATNKAWDKTNLEGKLPQYGMANKTEMTPDENAFWADQYAQGNVDPQFLSGMFSSRSGDKAKVLQGIVQGAQNANPDVNISKDIGDFNSSKNQKNRGTVATIDNVRGRMDRILELSNSIDRTQSPTLNKYFLSGARGVGAMKATMLKLNEDLTGEELNQVFGGGSAGSDAKLKLAQEISALGDLPLDVAAEKIKEINGALDTRKSTFVNQMGRYSGQSTNKKTLTPEQKQMVLWAKKNTADPRASVIMSSYGGN